MEKGKERKKSDEENDGQNQKNQNNEAQKNQSNANLRKKKMKLISQKYVIQFNSIYFLLKSQHKIMEQQDNV